MKITQMLSDNIHKLEKCLVIIIIPVMLITMALDIFFRYFLSSPLVWAQELALYSFVWSGFIGASMSIKAKEAVAVTLIVDKIHSKLKNILIMIGLLASIGFSIYVLYLSVTWIINPTILLQKSITTQMPMIYMYLSIPVSIFFMTIHFINWFFESLQFTREGKVIE